MLMTEAQLRKAIRSPYVKEWHNALFAPRTELGGASLLEDYEINTPRRVAMFMAQCAHESGGFTTLKENLNYKWQSLRKLFPKYFPTDELAQQYAAKPNKQQAIASRIYAGRYGNGDESSGDGFRYSGHGLIQLTFRDNWQAFADSIETPLADLGEYMQTFEGAAQSACWFWEKNNLNRTADAGDVVANTKIVNGGKFGLEDRQHHYEDMLTIMGAR